MSRRTAPLWAVWFVYLGAATLATLPLPDWLAIAAPPWAALAVIYWSMMWPHRCGMGWAFLTGLYADLLTGAALGREALVLVIVAYLTFRLHLRMRLFPMWQLSLTVFGLLAVGGFARLAVDFALGYGDLGIGRWLPVVAGAAIWPLVMASLDLLRGRLERTEHMDFDLGHESR